MNNARAIVGRAVSQSVVWKIAQETVWFFLSVAIARLLSPSDYGIAAIAMISVSALEVLCESSFHTAAIYLKLEKKREVTTVWWAQLVGASVMVLVAWHLAPLVARFYGSDAVTGMTRLFGWGLLVNALGAGARLEMKRTMRFSALAMQECVASIFAVSIGLALARAGWGMESLAFVALCRVTAANFLAAATTRWLPSFQFDAAAARRLFGYLRSQLTFNLIHFWTRAADGLIVGRLAGTTALGLYTRGQSLSLIPVQKTFEVLSLTVFVVLVKLKDDKERAASVYLRVVNAVVFMLYPVLTFLAVFADDIVRCVFGIAWAGCVPMLRVMALTALIQCLSISMGWLYGSQGRPDLLLRLGTAASFVQLAGVSLGALAGEPREVALGYLAGVTVSAVPYIGQGLRLISLSPTRLLFVSARALGCALTAAIGALLVTRLQPLGAWQRIFLGLGIAAPAYLALSWVFQRGILGELVHTFRIAMKDAGPPATGDGETMDRMVG